MELIPLHAAPVSGQTAAFAGGLPPDWAEQTIGQFCTVKTGPFGTLLKASEYSELDGVPVISVGEIREGYFRLTEHTPLVPKKVQNRLPQYLLKAGDVVFGRKGAVERSALVRQPQAGWFLGSDGIAVRPTGEHCPEYVAAQFQSFRVRQWLASNSTGTTMASMNQGVLSRVAIPFPPTLDEERSIAEMLTGTDALIDSLEQLLTKKRQIKQGAMQELLIGKRRLPGFTSDWSPCLLGDVVAFSKGSGLSKASLLPNGLVPCIHYGQLFTEFGPVIHAVHSYTDEANEGAISQVGDVLMPTSDVTPRGLAKASCVLLRGVALGGDILILRPNDSLLHGPFLSNLIRSQPDRVLELVTGSTVFHLYGRDMAGYRLSLPPVEEQIAIVQVLSDLDVEVATIEFRLKKARALKQAMAQALLTGRIRLVESKP